MREERKSGSGEPTDKGRREKAGAESRRIRAERKSRSGEPIDEGREKKRERRAGG